MKKENLFYIDVIKILACLIVILCHYDVHSYYELGNKAVMISKLRILNVYEGDIGVSLFIIMSGLTLALSSNIDFSVIKFYKKRFLAIMPSYWISYIIVALVFIIMGNTIGDGKYWKIIFTVMGIDGFLLLFRFQSFYLIGEWYTGYMLLTYVLFPFVYKKMKKTPYEIYIIILLFNIILFLKYGVFFKVLRDQNNPLMRLLDFGFGILFTLKLSKNKSLKNSLLIVGLVYILMYKKMFNILPYYYHQTIIGISIFLVLEYLISKIKISSEHKIYKWTRYLASLTFLAFLVHHQIIMVLYSKINNFSGMNYLYKLFIFMVVVVLSFGYAALIQPLVIKITKILKNRILNNNSQILLEKEENKK